eukprot:TRINITY_DN73014_c0_g1_i1.p1 TRINITY_DN73014_c0_g1~~TRINITY_DN73014_c0_g1_i1.p1  ORF type:complete len:215 (+),score=43.93 TRINITY_DN73014_c0_g1_i1:83-727(+)
MNYEVVGSQVAYAGKILQVAVDDIVYTESGRKSKREVVVKDDFVMIIPVMADGSLLCVRQFRHPFKQMAIGFPAGRVDAGESPEDAALRELQEEAFVRPAKLTKLAEMHEVPEFARSTGHLYVAEGLEAVKKEGRDEGEATMEVLRLKEEELCNLIAQGEIRSVTIIAAMQHFQTYRGYRAPSLLDGSLTRIALVLIVVSACWSGWFHGRRRHR